MIEALQPYSTALMFLALELTALLFLVFVGVLVYFMKKRSTHAQTTTQFARNVEKNEPSRRAALTESFSKNLGLEGEELETRVTEFLNKESAFFKTLLMVFLSKDGKFLDKAFQDLNQMMDDWANMLPDSAVNDAEIERLNESLQNMQEENARISNELETNSADLEALTNEYNAAFNKEQQGADKSAEVPQDAPAGEAATPPPDSVETEIPASPGNDSPQAAAAEGPADPDQDPAQATAKAETREKPQQPPPEQAEDAAPVSPTAEPAQTKSEPPVAAEPNTTSTETAHKEDPSTALADISDDDIDMLFDEASSSTIGVTESADEIFDDLPDADQTALPGDVDTPAPVQQTDSTNQIDDEEIDDEEIDDIFDLTGESETDDAESLKTNGADEPVAETGRDESTEDHVATEEPDAAVSEDSLDDLDIDDILDITRIDEAPETEPDDSTAEAEVAVENPAEKTGGINPTETLIDNLDFDLGSVTEVPDPAETAQDKEKDDDLDDFLDITKMD